jgi:hypothetical protein
MISELLIIFVILAIISVVLGVAKIAVKLVLWLIIIFFALAAISYVL